MKVGYHLKVDNLDNYKFFFRNFLAEGARFTSANIQKQEARNMDFAKSIQKYVLDGGDLDGKLLQQCAYPEVEADIFISHSHFDVSHNIIGPLAVWLEQGRQHKVFVDSWVWRNKSNLMSLVTNGHTNISECTKERLWEHIHCMLIKSLASMIDKCPIFLFVDTRNAMPRDGQTYSPWIYSELELSSLLLKHQRSQLDSGLEKLSENFSIRHTPEISHLKRIDLNCLNQWADSIASYSE